MKEEELRFLAEKFGTPLYIFDADLLKKRMEQVRAIVPDQIDLCYSIKANPFLIQPMSAFVSRLEVCSPGELEICMNQNVPGERIIYSGVNKGSADIREAIEYGAGILTAESLHHVRMLREEASAARKTIPVLLRLTGGNQFGMSKEDLFTVLEQAKEDSSLKIAGIHYFVGTGRKKLSQHEKELRMLADTYQEIRDRFGFMPGRLEYGPGLYYPYFEKDDFSDTLKPLKELIPLLKDISEITHVTMEMGRFFVSECGYYLTRIEDLKRDGETRYCIVDGGINHVNYYGQMMGMVQPVMKHFHEDSASEDASGGEEHYMLCGSLCTTADVLVRDCPLSRAKIGDLLAFYHIGAYSVTEGMYLFLSRALPMIVLTSKEKGSVVVRGRTKTSDFNCSRREDS